MHARRPAASPDADVGDRRGVTCVTCGTTLPVTVPAPEDIEVNRVADLPSGAKHDAYMKIHESEDFAVLRRKFRAFVIPATVGFLTWYLLYVLMSNYAGDFMSAKLIGNINVALVFGLLQFVSTFVIAWAYSTYANRELDPISIKINDKFTGEGH